MAATASTSGRTGRGPLDLGQRRRNAIVAIAQAALDGEDAESATPRLISRAVLEKLLEVLRELCPIEEAGMLIWFRELTYAVGRQNVAHLTEEGPDYWDAMVERCLDRLTDEPRRGKRSR
ncbi:hypothetical protein [Actinoallomurus sp. NPDC052274]|uniref:hypothetical protein n=1 Tax=Actinoallomurus sp. NPDC052274 TaxID=3155420 RepID=UPI0034350F82